MGKEVTNVLFDAMEFKAGEVVSSNVCLWTSLWTTGVRVSSPAGDAGIAVDDRA